MTIAELEAKWQPILDANLDYSILHKHRANVEPWLETQDGWFKIGSPEYKEYMNKMENKPQLLTEYDSSAARPLTDEEIGLLKIEEQNRKWVAEQKKKMPNFDEDDGARETF